MPQSIESSIEQSAANLYVPIVTPQNDSNAQNKNILKQCRICLQGQNQGRMVKPCLCNGSVTYAHQHCLIQWINRKHDPRIKMKVACQLCKYQFEYKVAKKHSLNCQVFANNMKKQKCNFATFIITVIFLFLAALMLIIIIIMQNSQGTMGTIIRQYIIKQQNTRIILICAIFFIFVFIAFISILFMTQYAVKAQLMISQIKDYQPIPKNMKKAKQKIYPNSRYI